MLYRYNKTITFYSLTLLISWMFWFLTAYLSNTTDDSIKIKIFGLVGLTAPVLIALYLIMNDSILFNDFKNRLIKINSHKKYFLLSLLIIPVSLVFGQLISVCFGHSLSQFYISGKTSFTSTVFSPWFILFFAPVVEELAWHSYGTDTLRRKFNLFNTSLIFSTYWVIWHIPLSLIKGYYHSNVVAEGLLYTFNFIFSLYVFVILMNWLYYKSNRNILITILFHLSANITNEIFATHPMSKVIQTVILLVLSIIIIWEEKDLFFKVEYQNTFNRAV